MRQKTTTSKLDKANRQKEKSPREGKRIRDPLLCTHGNHVRTLNWKPCVHAEDLLQIRASPVRVASVSVGACEACACGFEGSCFLDVLRPLWLLDSGSSSTRFPEF